ncbi:hypothetical protein D3C71_1850770 [compost metagenome]
MLCVVTTLLLPREFMFRLIHTTFDLTDSDAIVIKVAAICKEPMAQQPTDDVVIVTR